MAHVYDMRSQKYLGCQQETGPSPMEIRNMRSTYRGWVDAPWRLSAPPSGTQVDLWPELDTMFTTARDGLGNRWNLTQWSKDYMS